MGAWAYFFRLGVLGLSRQLSLVGKELCPLSLTNAGVEYRVGEAWGSPQSQSVFLHGSWKGTMFAVAPVYPSLCPLSKIPPEPLSSTPLLQEWLDSSEGHTY